MFTKLEEVVDMCRPTREAEFLHSLLDGCDGVLVTDVYSGYDGLPCRQQKCLVHLMRDRNDDVLKHPYDQELWGDASMFAGFLADIVSTIHRFGLRQCYLHKH